MADDEDRRKAEKPTTTPREAAALLDALFGLPRGRGADRLKPLDSYDDRNFYVPAAAAAAAAPGRVGRVGDARPPYLFKVHNGVESANRPVLAAQNAIMRHLHARGFACPVPVPSPAGNDTEFTAAAGADPSAGRTPGPGPFACRLLTWVPGRTLNSLTPTRARLLSSGAYLGRLRGALDAFDHPGCHREHLWDIRQTAGLRAFLHALDAAPDVRGVAGEVVDAYAALAGAGGVLSRLRWGVLQADFNDANIIFDDAGERVTGVIDFGDIVYSHVINDLAIAMAYSTLQPPEGLTRPETAAAVLEGYCTRADVSADELRVLRVLVACRLATSVTLGAFSALKDTADNEYLQLHAGPGRAALCDFWQRDAATTDALFQAAAARGRAVKAAAKAAPAYDVAGKAAGSVQSRRVVAMALVGTLAYTGFSTLYRR